MKQEIQNKTPKFDVLLDEILEKIIPQDCECLQHNIFKYCERIFKITKEDIEFYKF